jgi:hypothetical protein
MSKRLAFTRHAAGWLAPVVLSVLLAGCALTPPGAPQPALAQLPAIESQVQRLTFVTGERQQVLLGVLRHQDKTLRLALLSPQGQRLLTLVQDDQGARFLPEANIEPPFSADWLTSRLSWNLWPADALREAFAGSHWRLAESNDERRIYRGSVLVARLSSAGLSDENNCRIIHDLESDYRLYIATIDDTFDDNARAPDTCPTP